MNFTRMNAILIRQFFLMRTSPARILPLFAWVLIDIVLWGFITRYLNTVSDPGFNFVPALLGAVLLWNFFIRIMHGVTMAFLEDVWSRNFLNVFATPLSRGEYIGGLVLSAIATSIIGLAAMMLLAWAVFGLSFLAYGVMLAPFLMILFLFGIALGIVASAIVLRMGPAAEWLVWPIPAFFSPFAGVFYPVATLPLWMQQVAFFMPPAHVFESMRAIVAGGQPSWPALAIGTALALAYVAAACWYFARTHKHAMRTGLIARYSAESLN